MSEVISYSDAQRAADAVYNRGGVLTLPEGWQLDTTFDEDGQFTGQTGVYVYALKPIGSDDGRRILDFRGTEFPNARDLHADFSDIGKEQFQNTQSAVNQWLAQQLVDGNRVELVGHSLGGALVQWAISDTNMAAVTNIVLNPDAGLRATTAQFASQLHFTTFNAPGITYVAGLTATDRTTVVSGEHHVIVGTIPYITGDPIHLVGGPPVGGTVIGHRVDFAALGERGLFAHDINKTAYWDLSQSPIVSYAPPYMDIGIAQSYAAHFSQLGNTDGTVTGDFEAAARLGLFLVASGVALGANTVALAAELRGLSFDRDVFANTIASPVNGINQGLAMILESAEAAGRNVASLSVRLADGFIEMLQGIGSFAGQVSGLVSNTLVPFLTDTAHGISNAVQDLLHDVPNTLFDLGRTLTFSDLTPFTHAYTQVLNDPKLDATLRTAIEQAQSIVQHAGQTVVIQTGVGPNPFHTPGYVPGGASSATVEERLGELFRLSLPFAAGPGGQHVSLQLQGPQANELSIVTDEGVQAVGSNGTVEVLVPEGADQLRFTLLASKEVSADATVTLSATLVDTNGDATHTTQIENIVSVKAFTGNTDARYQIWEENYEDALVGVPMGVFGLFLSSLRPALLKREIFSRFINT